MGVIQPGGKASIRISLPGENRKWTDDEAALSGTLTFGDEVVVLGW
jgi:hypothetical protein